MPFLSVDPVADTARHDGSSPWCVSLPKAAGIARVTVQAENEDAVSTYATALASVADSDEKLKEIHFDMDRLATIIKNSADVQDFLTNPSVNEDKQKEVLGTICRDAGFVQQTQNFLNLVVDKGRAGLLEDICRTFEEQYCQMTSTQVRETCMWERAIVWMRDLLDLGGGFDIGLSDG